MKILFAASDLRSLRRFRLPLIQSFQEKGHDVRLMAPKADFSILFQNQKKNPWEDLKTLKKIYHIFSKWKPDIIYSYHLKPTLYIGLLLYLFPKIIYFPTLTGLGYLKKASLLHFFYKQSMKRARKIFVQNQDDIEWMRKHILDDPKKYCHVFGSGIDLVDFPFHEMPTTALSFLFVGRFLKSKGVLDYIRAFGKLKERYPLIKASLIGMSDQHPDAVLESEIKKECQDNHVDFIGYVEDVKPYLISHHVFVLPSFYPEGVPRAGIEALAIGRVVITTKHPGCQDLVLNNNGFLIQDSLEASMELCLSSDLSKMGKKSRELAENIFDVQKINAHYFKAFHAL